MAGHSTTRTRLAGAVLLAVGVCGLAAAQGQVVDRGTSDFGPNSASQRHVEPGNAQFSPETALTDRFGPASPAQLADLYHRSDVSRRFLYQAPGYAALYNQSDYITRDSTGLVGLNGANQGTGRLVAITPADVVYVLSPELLNDPTQPVEAGPGVGEVDHRLRLTPLTGPTLGAGPDGRVSTQVDGRYDPSRPPAVDIAAIHRQMRGAQRDPRLVERSRRWREEREREERAAREREAEPDDAAAAAAEDEAEGEGSAGEGSGGAAPASGE